MADDAIGELVSGPTPDGTMPSNVMAHHDTFATEFLDSPESPTNIDYSVRDLGGPFHNFDDQREQQQSPHHLKGASKENKQLTSRQAALGLQASALSMSGLARNVFSQRTKTSRATAPARGQSTAAKERRRERNKVLARKTRIRKKAELEKLRSLLTALQRENTSLKNVVQGRLPSHLAGNILEACQVPLPESVVSAVDMLMSRPEPVSAYPLREASKSGKSFIICNAKLQDHPIIYASPGFCGLTGYALDDIIGRNCRFLQGPDTDKEEVLFMAKSMRASRDVSVTLLNYRADGSTFWNRIQVSAMLDVDGRVALYVGLQHQASSYEKPVLREVPGVSVVNTADTKGSSEPSPNSPSGLPVTRHGLDEYDVDIVLQAMGLPTQQAGKEIVSSRLMGMENDNFGGDVLCNSGMEMAMLGAFSTDGREAMRADGHEDNFVYCSDSITGTTSGEQTSLGGASGSDQGSRVPSESNSKCGSENDDLNDGMLNE